MLYTNIYYNKQDSVTLWAIIVPSRGRKSLHDRRSPIVDGTERCCSPAAPLLSRDQHDFTVLRHPTSLV